MAPQILAFVGIHFPMGTKPRREQGTFWLLDWSIHGYQRALLLFYPKNGLYLSTKSSIQKFSFKNCLLFWLNGFFSITSTKMILFREKQYVATSDKSLDFYGIFWYKMTISAKTLFYLAKKGGETMKRSIALRIPSARYCGVSLRKSFGDVRILNRGKSYF